MTTRGSLARGQGQQQFQGNVQKWVRQWVEPSTGPGSSKAALLKWVPTGDRSGSKPGPRFPHLQPVSNPDLKLPAGNKEKGKKLTPRQLQLASQPAAMDVDGGQPVLASKLQQEGDQSAALNASIAAENNGKADTVPGSHFKRIAAELPVQELPVAASQQAAGAFSGPREIDAAPEVDQILPDVATKPSQASESHAHPAHPDMMASAIDPDLHQAALASQSDPDTQQQQPQQEMAHTSPQEVQDTRSANSGGEAAEKIPVLVSVTDEVPGQAPAGMVDEALTGRQAPSQAPVGKDDEALTGQEAPDQAVAADWDGALAGDQSQSRTHDESLTGPGLSSGGENQAQVSTAAEAVAPAATVEEAVQLRQPAGGAAVEPHALDARPQTHHEPAPAAPTPAKRPAEGVGEGMELDAKRTKTGSGPA